MPCSSYVRAAMVAACAPGLLPATASAQKPTKVNLPVVSGTTTAGETLTTTNGTWNNAPTSYAYNWLRCDTAGAACVQIAGAKAETYTLTAAEVGATVRASVHAKNATGTTTAKSKPTAVVAAAHDDDPPPPPPTGGLSVSGNKLLNESGNVVQLHGVNYPGTEYACIQGWGIFDGPSDDASVAAIRSWNSNVVHLGLNEDCVLGINGVKAAYGGENYLGAVVEYVNRLHAHGMYAEVSLMWAAPGTQKAQDHPPILDADHAPAALRAIANAFKDDPRTFIGLQSEPHDIGWA